MEKNLPLPHVIKNWLYQYYVILFYFGCATLLAGVCSMIATVDHPTVKYPYAICIAGGLIMFVALIVDQLQPQKN